MLKQLNLKNFTVFTQADFQFSPGINVIVGENGTGKSHVLKLAYAVIAESRSQFNKHTNAVDVATEAKLRINNYLEKILNVFRANSMESFARNNSYIDGDGFQVDLSGNNPLFSFNLKYDDKGAVTQVAKPIKDHQPATAIFLPTRELLTIYPGFVSLYEGRYLEFDETYRDTCLLLGDPLLKKPMTDLLAILEEAMGGKVLLERSRFYLVYDFGKVEIPMVAEGIRKLAMLAQLIAVGALQKDGYLFWDEPEANLNPRLIRVIARVILQLASAGIQVFIATHSYFLLKELDILTTQQPVPTRYFSLLKGEDGVVVESGDSLDDLQSIVALEEELAQFDREQDAHHA